MNRHSQFKLKPRPLLIKKTSRQRQGDPTRQPIAVSDISIYICLIDIRSKSKEHLNERRAGLSSFITMDNEHIVMMD